MGKFYELFEMDAHVGAKELDLQYMKVKKLFDFGVAYYFQFTFIHRGYCFSGRPASLWIPRKELCTKCREVGSQGYFFLQVVDILTYMYINLIFL